MVLEISAFNVLAHEDTVGMRLFFEINSLHLHNTITFQHILITQHEKYIYTYIMINCHEVIISVVPCYRLRKYLKFEMVDTCSFMLHMIKFMI